MRLHLPIEPNRLIVLFLLAEYAFAASPPMGEPALSPNHQEIAFVSGGDIWVVASSGGEAHLLVSNPATESRPLYSPDGTRLAFISTRTGNGDIYVMQLATGDLKRITFDDTRASLDAWSADGKYLYFTSNRADVAGMNDLYRVLSTGGTPAAIAADRYADESEAAPNPASAVVAFVSSNMANNQWWRRGHAHIDESRLSLVTPAVSRDSAPVYQPLLDNQAKNLWPMWSADGKELFFMSDKSGVENIWRMTPGGAPKQITNFTDGRVLWPSIAADGKAIVFEREFRIWKLDLASGRAAALEIGLRGAPAGPATTHMSMTTGFRDLALSPDGKKIAFIAHGEIFAASAKDGGNGTRITRTAANEGTIVWAPDSARILYLSDRDGPAHIFTWDFAKESETQLTRSPEADENPVWSPDGKQIAYIHDGRELHVMELASTKDRVLLKRSRPELGSAIRASLGGTGNLSWSPDGQWLSVFQYDGKGFRNAALLPAAGGSETQISFLANASASSVVWNRDMTWLLYSTGQRTEKRIVARIDLQPRTPKFREDTFRDLFVSPKEAASAKETASVKETAPVREIVYEGIRNRVTEFPLGLDARSPVISPDGKTLLFIADVAGQENLYTYSLDELARERPVPRQLTSTAGRKADPYFSPDGKDVFFLDAGRIGTITVESRTARTLAVTAELDVDFALEKKEVFQQAWSILNEGYYDPNFHGANWSDQRGRFAPFIEGARTPDEVRRVLSLMIGELNSSHTGITAGTAAAPTPVTGRLGIAVDPSDNAIVSVTPLGPADVAGIKAGEKLISIDGMPLNEQTNLDELLQHTIGKRTILKTSAHENAVMLPVNTATEKRLLYRAWVEDRRAFVGKISGGRLGYVHMLDMSADALDQLYLDLDALNETKEGVVVDVRNNNGGFVNAYALDVFTRRPYLTMTRRDRGSAPARANLGQRALETPTVLVVNQNTLSDSEDFTEGYRAMKLGKVVGTPTAGWIIYTGSEDLIDGSVLRTPGTRITGADGTDMELHPRPVDIRAERPVGESYTGHDAQLEAAVKALLAELPAGR